MLVPDLGRVAPDWWRLSHISEGQNNSLFIPAWLLLCAHAWFMPWTHGKKKKNACMFSVFLHDILHSPTY